MDSESELSYYDQTAYSSSRSPSPVRHPVRSLPPLPFQPQVPAPRQCPPPPSEEPLLPALLVLRHKSTRIFINADSSYTNVLHSARIIFSNIPVDDRKVYLKANVNIVDSKGHIETVRARITPETWPRVRTHVRACGPSAAELEVCTESRWARLLPMTIRPMLFSQSKQPSSSPPTAEDFRDKDRPEMLPVYNLREDHTSKEL